MYFFITGTNVPMPQANPPTIPPNSHQRLLAQAFDMAMQQFQIDVTSGLPAATNPRTRNYYFERLVSRFVRQVYRNFSSLWSVSFDAGADGKPTADPTPGVGLDSKFDYFREYGTIFNPPSAMAGCP